MKKNIIHSGKWSKQRVVAIICLLLCLFLIIIAMIHFMNGNTLITNRRIDDIKIAELNCTSDTLQYPFFTYKATDRHNLNIRMTFANNDLEIIALDYSLFYDNDESLKASEAHNHAAMNKSYTTNGLSADALNAKYTILKDRMRLNLYANGHDLNENTAKYFLVDLDTENNLAKSPVEYQQYYVDRGFKCEISH